MLSIYAYHVRINCRRLLCRLSVHRNLNIFLMQAFHSTDSEENKTSVSVILNQEESVLELFEENNVVTILNVFNIVMMNLY